MAFELEQQLEDVTTRNIGNVEALLARRMEDSKKVAEFREILQKSTDAHQNAMKDVLNEKLELVKNYVDTHIKSIAEPKEYDVLRVATLRNIVANGSNESVESRCDRMSALWELQLYLKKFPLVDRVADIVRKWTKCPDVEVKGKDHFKRILYINGSAVMSSTDSPREYYDYHSNPPRQMSMANICVFGRNSDHRIEIVNFWELYIGMKHLDLKYILGVSECEKWGENIEPLTEYSHNLHRICTNSGRVERRNDLFKTMADESFAPIVILNVMDKLTVNQCLDGADSMDIECGNVIRHVFAMYLQRVFKNDTAQSKYQFSFDTEKRKFKWVVKKNTEGSLQFDPDTCELLQPEIEWNSISVGEVVIRDLHEYVAGRIPWMACYGTEKIWVECFNGIDLLAEWNNRGMDLFESYYENSFKVLSIEKTNTENLYSMEVVLRVSREEAFQFAHTMGADGWYKLCCDVPMWADKPMIH